MNEVTHGKKFWRTDTKALVGAVILGIAFVLVQQVAHRIDNMIWPPLLIIGGITWATFTGLITLIFKQPAGLITAETQALISLFTGLSPLAIFFIPANGLASIAYWLVMRVCSMQKWSHHFWAQVASNLTGNIIVGIGLKMIFHMPLMAIVISSAITTVAGIIGATILTKILADKIQKSGLI